MVTGAFFVSLNVNFGDSDRDAALCGWVAAFRQLMTVLCYVALENEHSY